MTRCLIEIRKIRWVLSSYYSILKIVFGTVSKQKSIPKPNMPFFPCLKRNQTPQIFHIWFGLTDLRPIQIHSQMIMYHIRIHILPKTRTTVHCSQLINKPVTLRSFCMDSSINVSFRKVTSKFKRTTQSCHLIQTASFVAANTLT